MRKLRLFALLLAPMLFCALPSCAQWPYVPIIQSQVKQQNAASITCVFNNNVTSGNIVLVGISYEGTTNTPTVTDTRSTSYTQKLSNTANTLKVAVYAGTLGSSGR